MKNDRDKPKGVRATHRWTKLSKEHRTKNPLCFNPFNLHSVKVADDVHHIFPIRLWPELAYNKSNLVSLCRQCHNAGKPTAWIFGKTITDITKNKVGYIKSLGDNKIQTGALIKKNAHNNLGGGGLTECCRTEHYKNKVFCLKMLNFKEMFCGNCLLKKEENGST